jgi:hypothetical protein
MTGTDKSAATTESPDLRRLKGDRDWSGYLTLDNFEAVADRLRKLLDGHPYTWVACNEGFGYRPEVRPGLLMEKVAATLLAPDHGHITVADTYGVWGLSAHWPTRADAYAAGSYDEAIKRGAHVAFKSDRYGEQFSAEHFAPTGSRLYWTVAVEHRGEAEL